MTSLHRFAPALLGLALTGCLARPVASPLPQTLTLLGESTPRINPDAQGEGMSLVVNVYQLKDKAEFQKLTFEGASSGRPDTELLGADLIARHELILIPGQPLEARMALHPQCRYLALVGLFRQPDPHAWRTLARLDQVVGASMGEGRPLGSASPTLRFRADRGLLHLVRIPQEPLSAGPGSPPSEALLPHRGELPTLPRSLAPGGTR